MNEVQTVGSLQVCPLYFVISLIGGWLISDGIVSLASYRYRPPYNDTWLKVVRIVMGFVLIAIGVYLGI